MPGIINTGTHPRLLWPGVKAIWGQVNDEHPKEYPDCYEVLDSDRAYELDYKVSGFGLAPVKPQGDGVEYDYEVAGGETRYTHISYALGYQVTYEERKDNLYAEVSNRRASANAFSMAQTIENVCAVLYNNITVTTYYTTWDALAIASTAHLNMTGGTFSNMLNPAADLAEVSLEDMCVQLMGASNDRGLLISVMPRTLHVARQEWFNANRILKSVLQPDATSNNINVLKATNAFPGGIKMNHYFTNAKRWFVRTNVRNGMKMYWNERPSLDTDNDFDTKNHKVSSYMRFSIGCTDPLGIFTSNAS